MGDVDKLQAADEAAAQRAEQAEHQRQQRRVDALRAEPLRTTAAKARATRDLGLGQLHAGDNIRLDLPEIDELARSIREVGLLTPPIVRPWVTGSEADGPLPQDAEPGVDQFRLVAGHRRLAALRALVDAGVDGFSCVQCEVREDLSQAEAYALMLTENVQRVPLEPIQAARALRLLLDLNPDLDAATLARSLGLRPTWTQTHLKLLDLPREVQDRIDAGDLSVTIADLLRRGHAAGRLDEQAVVDLATRRAAGAISAAQVRQEAGPPRTPNTAPPRTVRAGEGAGPDGPFAGWDSPSNAFFMDDRVPRPPTPLTAPSRSAADARAAAAPGAARSERVADDTPVEDRLDAYLLGRALVEWADDGYLDSLGIDRSQAQTWAQVLEFEERIAAIRQLSSALMRAERASAAPA